MFICVARADDDNVNSALPTVPNARCDRETGHGRNAWWVGAHCSASPKFSIAPGNRNGTDVTGTQMFLIDTSRKHPPKMKPQHIAPTEGVVGEPSHTT